MKLAIIGTGYVGLVSGACLAEIGHSVCFADISTERIRAINESICPIYEPGLSKLLKKNKGRIRGTAKTKEAVSESDAALICVGTPQSKNGSTSMKHVFSACRDIARALAKKDAHFIVIAKSTIPPTRLGQMIAEIERASGKREGKDFSFCANPEFLREGSAVNDFMHPDRIVIGCKDERCKNALSELYKPLGAKMFFCDPKTAMMVKYASNAFLAAKISFANEMGNVCKKLGIDSFTVADGMGLDGRIERKFLNSGCGFGGSCFPKDVASLAYEAKKSGIKPQMLVSALLVNKAQPQKMIELLEARLGNLKGKKISVLGLAFKPDTDDVRESPALIVMQALLEKGAILFAYDPKGMENARKIFANAAYCQSAQEAIDKSDAILIMADWKEFENIDTGKYVLEGKRILKGKRENYEGICW